MTTMVWKENNGSPRGIHLLIPRTSDMTKLKNAERFKVAQQMIRKIILDYPGEPSTVTQAIKNKSGTQRVARDVV